jgi:hypothetical protein
MPGVEVTIPTLISSNLNFANDKGILDLVINPNGNEYINLSSKVGTTITRENDDPIPVPPVGIPVSIAVPVKATSPVIANPYNPVLVASGTNADNNKESPLSNSVTVSVPIKECPTCHSNISAISPYRQQGEEVAGETVSVVDPVTLETRILRSSTSGAIPQWTFDPILTENEFNGSEYEGRMRFISEMIQELQNARIVEEELAGLTSEQKTIFTFLGDINLRDRALLFIELRQSTEKILNATGSTLKEYFSTNKDGESKNAGPNDVGDKEEWSIVERGRPYLDINGQTQTTFTLPDGTTKDSPSLPNRARPWAILFEDLRHPLILGWQEFFSTTQPFLIDLKPESGGTHQYKKEESHDSNFWAAFEYVKPDHTIGHAVGHFLLFDSSLYQYEIIYPFCAPGIVPPGSNSFDIHPSDGGMRFLGTDGHNRFYDGERTWFVSGKSSKVKKMNSQTAENEHYPYPSLSNNVEGSSSGKIELTPSVNPEILVKKPTAKLLKFNAKSLTESGGSLEAGWSGFYWLDGGTNSHLQATHRWSYVWVPPGPGPKAPDDVYLGATLESPSLDGYLFKLEDHTNRLIKMQKETRFMGQISIDPQVTVEGPSYGPATYGLAYATVILRLIFANYSANITYVDLVMQLAFNKDPDAVIETFDETNATSYSYDPDLHDRASISWIQKVKTARTVNIDISLDTVFQTLQSRYPSVGYKPQTIKNEDNQDVPNPHASQGYFTWVTCSTDAVTYSFSGSVGGGKAEVDVNATMGDFMIVNKKRTNV